MHLFLNRLLQAGLIALVTTTLVSADTKTPTDQARERAYARIMEARRDGLSIVHTATELIVEGDKLCVADFKLVSKTTLRESNRKCFVVDGAYDKRRAGLSRERLSGVRQYVLNYPNCGQWSKLVTDVLERKDIFPELQQLVQRDSVVRSYLLRVIVGHQALFYDPVTKGLNYCKL
jgi:hypothetical protein